MSPKRAHLKKKATIKFYKGNKSGQNLPPVKNAINLTVASGYSSDMYQARSSFPRIPIRDMSKAIETEASLNRKRKVKPPKPKPDPRKQLVKRLMLLDSVGKSNPVSTLGSIRQGYKPSTKVFCQSFLTIY